jgi:hypothetical protein
MVSKFRERLPILQGNAAVSGRPLGVCAMGPVDPGETITWMRVWVWQQIGNKLAVSAGTSGEHLGGHNPSPTEQLPFTSAREWMIQTELEPGADQFTNGQPALAMAMAIIERDGDRDVETWSQAVMLGPGGGAGGGGGQGEHEHPEH